MEREKNGREKIPQNLEMALGLILTKFITGYETCFYKNSLQNAKFIAKYKLYGVIKK